MTMGRDPTTTSLALSAFFSLERASVSAPLHVFYGHSRDRALSGPVIGRWNRYLEHRFPLRTRTENATSFVALSKRVAVDQIVMAPIGVGPTPTPTISLLK